MTGDVRRSGEEKLGLRARAPRSERDESARRGRSLRNAGSQPALIFSASRRTALAFVLLPSLCFSGSVRAQDEPVVDTTILDESPELQRVFDPTSYSGDNLHRTLVDDREPAPLDRDLALDLQQRIKDVRVASTPEGLCVIVPSADGERRLTPDEYIELLARAKAEQESHGALYKLFNITTPWGILWVSIGFLGQALFTFRMVLQWLASEKHKRSIVPVAFWWGSLFGGMMLLVYFIWRKDIVGIVGQSTGAFVYARNLMLIYRRHPPTSATKVAEAAAAS